MSKRTHKVVMVAKRHNGDLAVTFSSGKTAIIKAGDEIFQAYAVYCALQG